MSHPFLMCLRLNYEIQTCCFEEHTKYSNPMTDAGIIKGQLLGEYQLNNFAFSGVLIVVVPLFYAPVITTSHDRTWVRVLGRRDAKAGGSAAERSRWYVRSRRVTEWWRPPLKTPPNPQVVAETTAKRRLSND